MPDNTGLKAPWRVLPAFLIAVFFSLATIGKTMEIWVAPNGSDVNSGASNAPVKTIPCALGKWKTFKCQRPAANGDSLRVLLRGGIYPVAETIVLDAEIIGTNTKPLSFEAAPGEKPVLSGGVAIRNWKKLSRSVSGLPKNARQNVWVADAPKINGRTLGFRQLWVDGSKAIRAREPNGGGLARLCAWDKTNQTAVVPASALCGVARPERLEMIVDQVWEIAILRVHSIHKSGTNAALTFEQPEGKIEFEHPWPPVIVKTNYHAPFYFANAIQFLNSPGEWFEDSRAGKVYYWPREGEDMARAEIISPAVETLVRIEGSRAAPVNGIKFTGISFANTTWLRPSALGHVPLQAGMFMLDARKLSPKGTSYHHALDNVAWVGRPPAAVIARNAGQISFEECTFEHLASAGLDLQNFTHDDLVEGCIFRDIGGNGIQLGAFSETNVETHTPYNPEDDREVCANEKISNNVLFDCGTEDWGCVGIAAGYVRTAVIEHNELFNLPYTGISLGWGWTKTTNAMRDNLVYANRIHYVCQTLGDTAGIYLLSAQPGTVVSENYVNDIKPSLYVSDPEHWFYLYLDEGSSFITVRDNWCPAERFLKNANGPGNTWQNNGPQVSEKIKNAAGLEPRFSHLLSVPPNH